MLGNDDRLPMRLACRAVRVFLLVLVLTCCGQDGADDGPRQIFPYPGEYDSATYCEYVFDAQYLMYYDNYFVGDPFSPFLYSPQMQCLFFFEAGENEVVEVTFDPDFEIELSDDCKYDYLEIRDGRFGFSPLIGRICGNQSPGKITSSGRYLWMLFETDDELEYSGFYATFRFIPAPTRSTPEPQECFFHLSGSYDGEFTIKMGTDLVRKEDAHAPMDCTWQIDMPEDNKILITFPLFELSSVNDCEENRLIIYDKYSTAKWMMREYCSTNAPAAMAISNRMFIRFIASNRSSYNQVEMMYTAYTDKPCLEEGMIVCGPYMCLNKSLKCNGRQNCWNYPFDEEGCNNDQKGSTKTVNTALAVTMGIILTVTLIVVVVTCRHSCLRTREKAKAMASRRKMLNQQVQILMDGENVEMNSLGERQSSANGKYPGSRTGSIADGVPRTTRLSSSSHEFPMTASQLKDYERIMDSELGFEPRQKRTSLMEPESPWVRANQYNESFRRSSANPLHPGKEVKVQF
ncbi:neuropilin and tolloid-like protein 2 isoform X2 [Acanthaster planci]|uniref:Neuropilin and tolloid-like protein 2 isoform X2 n=1 Tax=Acanthaster planci TaxID=133434 RepID=A0A8B7ZS50_ACAPL|nr:neuropilin and tolloid-like protein 2 isoform X2 [Acanthaster planci]XP_022107701.1 neuropilin and tolloid-like protein 2 isoform X2 [Acanthaster planci]